jgi:hypothetical protein
MHIDRIEIIPPSDKLSLDFFLEALLVPSDGPPRDSFLNTIPSSPKAGFMRNIPTDVRKRSLAKRP